VPESGSLIPNPETGAVSHPGGNPGANLKSISHICHPILVAFVWESTEETIDLHLGCLQGGPNPETGSVRCCGVAGLSDASATRIGQAGRESERERERGGGILLAQNGLWRRMINQTEADPALAWTPNT